MTQAADSLIYAIPLIRPCGHRPRGRKARARSAATTRRAFLHASMSPWWSSTLRSPWGNGVPDQHVVDELGADALLAVQKDDRCDAQRAFAPVSDGRGASKHP